MMRDLPLYAVAAFAEIGGCFAFWGWLRRGATAWWPACGLVLLAGFAALLTRTHADAAGRSFAAYGGIYILASILWLRVVEGQRITLTDMAGASVSLIGACIIMSGSKWRG